MYPLCVVGSTDTDTTGLTERLVGALDGRVATVTRVPDTGTEGAGTARRRAAGAAETYRLTDEGAWAATGLDRDLDGLLDELAVDHDYVLLEGFGDTVFPTVALGDRNHAGETLARGPGADAIDVDAVRAALHDREPYESLASLIAEVERLSVATYAGAIATFTGRVRAKETEDDAPTEHLEFERYDGVAADRMSTIESELAARDGVHAVRLHHRTGVIEAGEDIVFVVVLAGHREEAFAAVSDGIDRLKAEVPLFKKEVTVNDEFWAHQHDRTHHPG